MADSKISALAAITSLAGTEELVVANSGVSNKITTANVKTFMAGYEIGYTEITSPVTIASTSEGTPTTIISPGALTFDGGAVMVEFFCPYIQPNTANGGLITVCLFESTTNLGRLALYICPSGQLNYYAVTGRYRFTPTAASHTYTITAFTSNTGGTPQIGAGAAGSGAYVPAFVRFTKV